MVNKAFMMSNFLIVPKTVEQFDIPILKGEIAPKTTEYPSTQSSTPALKGGIGAHVESQFA